MEQSVLTPTMPCAAGNIFFVKKAENILRLLRRLPAAMLLFAMLFAFPRQADAQPGMTTINITNFTGAYTGGQTAAFQLTFAQTPPTLNPVNFSISSAQGVTAPVVSSVTMNGNSCTVAVIFTGNGGIMSLTPLLVYDPGTFSFINFTGNTSGFATIPAVGPVISESGTLGVLTTTAGTASSPPAGFSVSGANMTAGITATAPSGFEVSMDGNNFSNTVTVGSSGAIISTPLYVRLLASDPGGVYNGNIALTSSGAAEVDLSVGGMVSTPPTVTSVSVPANGRYPAGKNLDFAVNFLGNMLVTGTPSIPITIGSNRVNATFISGSGTTTLIFRYATSAGDNGVISVGSAILLNGGTIITGDGSFNNAVLTLNNVGGTTGIFVDTQAPAISGVTFTSNDGGNGTNAGAGNKVTFSFTTSEPVQMPVVTIGNGTAAVTNPSGDNQTFIATYTLQSTDSPDRSGNVPYTIALTDLAGNTANFDETTAGGPQITLYTTPTTQAGNVTFTDVTTASATLNWTPGNGNYEMVLMAPVGTTPVFPVNNAGYGFYHTYGGFPFSVGSSWSIVYNNPSTSSAPVDGLSPGVAYSVMVIDYNVNTSQPGGFTVFQYLTTAGTNNPATLTTAPPPAPTIASFSPASAPIGSLVTITGSNLSSPTVLTIGGQSAIPISDDGSTLVAMVMPNAVSGSISLTTTGGSGTASGSFTINPAIVPQAQQGSKLTETGGAFAQLGASAALSADGNTAIVGAPLDNGQGDAVVFTRSGGVWSQAAVLSGTASSGGFMGGAGEGHSVALSADGNTAVVGGNQDSNGKGAVWIFTQSGGTWTQQGSKIVATNTDGGTNDGQGSSVALSADGNTLVVGGSGANSGSGAAWVFTRNNGIWTQAAELSGTGNTSGSNQGRAVAISADGSTIMIGGSADNNDAGAVWVFTGGGAAWVQQGSKLTPSDENQSDGGSYFGTSLALSADGNTAIIGGPADASLKGASWIFTRSSGVWSEQGSKLFGTGAIAQSQQGWSVAISADGNTVIEGGLEDNNSVGASWVFTRSGAAWSQQGTKLTGTGASGSGSQGTSVALSADGSTAMEGASVDNGGVGAAWVFNGAPAPTAPSTQASNVQFTTTTATTTTIGWTPGNGASEAVFVSQSSSGSPLPANNTTYNANITFGSGDQIGASGWYCVYNGSGSSSVNVTGLSGSATYNVMVADYNGTAGSEQYLTSAATGNPATVTTLTPNNATVGLMDNGQTAISFTVNFTNASTSGLNVNNFTVSSSVTGLNPVVTTVNYWGGDVGYQVLVSYNSNYNGTVTLTLANSAGITPSVSNLPQSYTFTAIVIAPFNQASQVNFSNTTTSATTINWAAGGSSASEAVFISQGDSRSPSPANNSTYNANAVFGLGDQIGSSGWYCVYNGAPASSVDVTGLSAGTTYNVMVLDYDGTTGSEQYLTSTGWENPGTVTTQAPTTTVVSIIPATSSPTSATSLDYTVTFASALSSPPLTTDFTLSGTATGTINSITTTDNINFDVNVTNVAGYGTLELDMTNGSNAAPNVSNTPFSGGAYTVIGVPTIQAGNVTFADVTTTSATINWTPGNGNYEMVLMAPVGTSPVLPVNNQGYGFYHSYGGYPLGNWSIVYNNPPASSAPVDGLSPGVSYTVMVIDYNVNIPDYSIFQYITTAGTNNPATLTTQLSTDATLSNITVSQGALDQSFPTNTTGFTEELTYDGSTPFTLTPVTNDPNATAVVTLNGNTVTGGVVLSYGQNVFNINVTAQDGVTTMPYTVTVTAAATAPAVQASSVSVTNTTANGTTIGWTPGDGTSEAVFVSLSGSNATLALANNSTYSASTQYGQGSPDGSGNWYCVYSGAAGSGSSVGITGLNPSTGYSVMVVDYNGTPGSEQYLTTSGTGNPTGLTTSAPPPITVSFDPPSPASTSSNAVGFNMMFSGGDPATFSSRLSAVTVNTTGSVTFGGVVMSGIGYGYTASVRFFTGNGTVSVTTPAGAAKDGYGDQSPSATSGVAFVNNAIAINAVTAASPNPSNGPSVNYTIQSSDVIEGLTAANFSLQTTSGTATGMIDQITNNNDGTYTVTVDNISGTGTFELDLTNITGITNINGVSGLILANLPVSGDTYTIVTPPAVQASNVTLTNTAITTTTINWTPGNGASEAVFVLNSSVQGSPSPVNNTTYRANTTFRSGAQIGSSGWYCVYNGSGASSLGITGLSAGSPYQVMVVDYDGTPGSEQYSIATTSGNPVAFATSVPPVQLTAGMATGTIIGCVGSASIYFQQFAVSGANLTGNVTVTAPTGFELSTSTSGSFAGSLTLTPGSGTLASTVIYARSAASDAVGAIAGNASVSSNGTSTLNVALSGTVKALATVDPVAAQTVDAGTATAAVNFTGTGAAYYSWTNDTPSIGLTASGTGSIPSFTAANTGSGPVTATITATPVGSYSRAYIANSGAGSVSVFNTATNALLTTIPVGKTPYGVSASPDGTKAYVTNQGDGTVSVINTATNSVAATVNLGAGTSPYGISVSPDGNKIYVADDGASSVSIIDATNNYAVNTIKGFTAATAIVASPDGSGAYVAAKDTLWMISAAGSKQVLATNANTSVAQLVVTPDGKQVYESSPTTNFIYIYNTLTRVSSSLGISISENNGLALTPDGSKLYVAGAASTYTISIVNTATNLVTDNLHFTSVGNNFGLSITADGSELYSTHEGAGTIDVYNTATKMYTTITPGKGPYSYGNFIATVEGCSGAPTTFTITVNPGPSITTTGSLAALSTAPGTASATTSFNVSATYLQSSVLVTAPTGFELSTDNSNFSGTVTLTGDGSGTLASTVVYVRLAAADPSGSYSGNIALTSANAATVNIPTINSTVLGAETITFNTLSPVTYGASDFAPGATSDNNNVAITYSSDKTSVATIVDGNIHIVGAGTANITAMQAADATHTAATSVIQPLTVNPAALIITPDNQTINYGAPLPTLTASYNQFVNGDNAGSLTPGPTITTTATSTSAPGAYAITASGAADPNYSISYVPGTLTIVASADATLSGIGLSAGSLFPAFSPAKTSYNVNVGNITGSITITPATNNANAAVVTTLNGSAVTWPATLSVGKNIFTIIVTAQNGTSTQAYTVTVTRAPSANANLFSLKMSKGIFSPAFVNSTTSYADAVGNTITSVTVTPTTADPTATVAVNAKTVPSGTASDPISLSIGPNPIYVTVTAQNGTTTRTDTVTVTRAPSANANLFSLKMSKGIFSPVFATTTTSYTDAVGNTVTSVMVTPTTADPTATVTVNAKTVPSGTASDPISLSVGPNPIYVTVTAQDGTTTSADTVTVTRAPSANANLFSLKMSKGIFSPVFATTTTSYTDAVGNTVTSVMVTPTTADPTATVTVNAKTVPSGTASDPISMSVGPNPIYVTVTAQDGTTTGADTVTVTRAPSANANLFSLKMSKGIFSPVFATTTTSYTDAVGKTITSVMVTPTTADPTATVTVNAKTVPSGTASDPISLNIGSNLIYVTVTAQDGTTTKTDTVIVTRPPSANANLFSLKMSKGIFSPVFATTTTSYTDAVGNTITSVMVTPTTADPTATVTVNAKTVPSGTASDPISLSIGANPIYVTVTAQDGTTTSADTVTVTRAPSANANLFSLKMSKGIFSPVFATTTTSYTDAVGKTITSVMVTPTTADPTATVTVNAKTVPSGTASDPISLNIGSNLIYVTVTAQDGTTTKTDTVIVTRPPSANANLFSLKMSKGIFSPVFTTTTTSYTDAVGNTITSVMVTPTTADPTATVTVNAKTVPSGTASDPISLNIGSNLIYVTVTAQDGTTTKTDTVIVTRAASTNDKLVSLRMSKGIFSPAFATTTTSYADAVGNTISSVTVTATTADPTAILQINTKTVPSGTASDPISLSVGPNPIYVTVTAQDGTTTRIDTVIVTRAQGSADSYDQGISVTIPIAIGTTETPSLAEDGVQVHQAISPNGDGINDFLLIDNISQYPDNKLSIMNRNGQLIYEARGYDNSSKVFDGHSNKNGQMQLPGTYFYQLDYTVSGVTKHKTGFLVLKY